MRRKPRWKCGFEIELMAPKGKSRESLAVALATAIGGKARRRFYPQSEIDTQSRVAGYETLTLAFDVMNAQGESSYVLADDITLNADIDQAIEGARGWYRILSTQKAVCDLVDLRCNAAASIEEVLVPLAKLYETRQTEAPGRIRLLHSRSGLLAAALPLAGDRERACEIITRPLTQDDDHHAFLGTAIDLARTEGFFVPSESATHIHFDGTPLQSPGALRNVVAVLHRFRLVLRGLFETNPACTRLGPWPQDALDLVFSDAFLKMDWKTAARALERTKLEKWCDFNLLNLICPFATKRTIEVRILPTRLDADALVETAVYFETLLERALRCPVLAPLPTLPDSPAARDTLAAFLAGGQWQSHLQSAPSSNQRFLERESDHTAKTMMRPFMTI